MEQPKLSKQNSLSLYKSDLNDDYGDVMIVGGGISGIQAALDLGTAGFKVFFIEKSPTVGGKMAHLDKTFPTNDCSMCIESPKFVECKRHPNIGRIVDVPGTVEYAKSLPNVVHAEESLFICSTEAAAMLAKDIEERGLNRVIVAACTPRTHEPLFRDTLREAGINQYYYDMANIREHCSWVHSKEKEKATQKAKDIIRMSVARSFFLEPLQEFDLPVDKRALVVGGGIAGMTCALSIANQDHEVFLIEKQAELGGMGRKVHITLEGVDVQGFVDDLERKVYAHPLIHVYTEAVVKEAAGYVGNFTTRIQSERGPSEIKHGATVIAIGARI